MDFSFGTAAYTRWAASCPDKIWRAKLATLTQADAARHRKLRRREKNRQSARTSAKRKHETTLATEATYNALVAENGRMRSALLHYEGSAVLYPPQPVTGVVLAASGGVVLTQVGATLVAHSSQGPVALLSSDNATMVAMGGTKAPIVAAVIGRRFVTWSAATGLVLNEQTLDAAPVTVAASAQGGAATTANHIFCLPLWQPPTKASGKWGAIAMDDVTPTVVGCNANGIVAAPLTLATSFTLFNNAIANPTTMAMAGTNVFVVTTSNCVHILTRAPDNHVAVPLDDVRAVAAGCVVAVLCAQGIVALNYMGDQLHVSHAACSRSGLSVAGKEVWANGVRIF